MIYNTIMEIKAIEPTNTMGQPIVNNDPDDYEPTQSIRGMLHAWYTVLRYGYTVETMGDNLQTDHTISNT
ncbi:MAG: hypothetical protein KCHDKBKB_00682 [Elusimicrobia bacterium]|nr:hypothetical protein [Elusimicrobiota bacterium]